MFKITRFLTLLLIIGFVLPQEVDAAAPQLPPLPEPIATLQKDGAQMKYLGRDLGFDGWIAIKNGQEQYFYVTPDGSAFFLGVLFNKNGRAVTFDQMKRLQGQPDPAFQDLKNAPSQTLGSKTINSINPPPLTAPSASPIDSNIPNKMSKLHTNSASPSEQFMADVQAGYSFPLGPATTPTTAPMIYMFADPLCPHCKDMIRMLDPALTRGDIQVRVLLVGALAPDSAPLASGIISQKDPGAALREFMNGTGNFKKGDPNNAKIAENLGILTKWKFDGTPVTTYRAKDGTIKLLQGPPKSLDILLQDLR